MKLPLWRGLVGCALVALFVAAAAGQSPPMVDHHQHLFSPAAVALAPGLKPVSADDLVRFLDEAGIRKSGRPLGGVPIQQSEPTRHPRRVRGSQGGE